MIENRPGIGKLLKLHQVAVTSAVVVLFYIIVMSYEIFSYRNSIVEKVQTLSNVLAHNVAPALMFKDKEESFRVLTSVQDENLVKSITLYDSIFQPFTSWPSGAKALSELPEKGWLYKTTDSVIYIRPIFDDFNSRSGTLAIEITLRPFVQDLILLSLAMGASSLLLILLGIYVLNKRTNKLVAPIQGLVQTMADITHKKDYTIRVAGRVSGDNTQEIHAMMEEFDQLLGTVERSNAELLRINENLETRVSERTAERDLERQKSVQAGKIFSLGVMSAGIAHEINNPLAAIKVSADILSHMVKKNNIEQQMVEQISTNINQLIERISRITKGLRTFARDSSNDPFEDVDIHAVVEDALLFCRTKYKNSGVDICVNVAPKTHLTSGRLNQLSQVVLNLLNNAYDAIEKYSEKWVRIDCESIDGIIRLSITDSGKGISEAVQKNLFEPFFTTKGIGKGTGIGLSISVGIIEAHNGRIFYDQEHPNTRFIIELPCAG